MASFIAQKLAGPYLKEYFEPGYVGPSINTFSGTVTVEKMRFKPKALDFLNLPVQIKIGYVGKIVATINYSALMSSSPVRSPVKASVSDVFIVVGPNTGETKFDPKKYVEDMISAKMASLLTWQNASFPDNKEAQEAYGMADKIQDNISVDVRNLHVRFESEAYAFGMLLEKITIETTDKDYKPTTPPKEPTCIFRKLEMSKFSLYLNTRDELGDRHEMATLPMLEDAWKKPEDAQQYAWIIPPISAELRLAQEKADEEKLAPQGIAKTRADLIFKPLGFTLSKCQYYNMLKMLEDVSQEPPEVPKIEYNEKPEDSERDEYISLYKKLFEDEKGSYEYPKLKKKELIKMVEFEKKWSFNNVVQFRLNAYEVSKLELETDSPQRTSRIRDGRGGITGGIASMFISGPRSAKVLSKDQYKAVLDTKGEEEKKAQELLDKMERLPKKYVHTVANVVFQQLFFTMKDDKHEIIVFEINDMRLSYQARPQSMQAAVSVKELNAQDHVTPNSQHRYFLRNTGSDEKTQLVDIQYETNPPDNPNDLDSVAKVRLDSIDVVVLMNLIDEISNFFTPPEPVNLSQLKDQAMEKLAEIQQDASQRLMQAIENRRRTLIDVVIKAPCIVIPEDPTSETSNVLVLDLGTLMLKSRLAQRLKTTKEIKQLIETANSQKELTESYQESLYDSFVLELKDLSLFLSEQGAKWRSVDAKQRMVIVEPFSIPLALDNAISTALLSLPSINAKGSITRLHLAVSSLRVRRLLKISEALSAASPESEASLDDSKYSLEKKAAATAGAAPGVAGDSKEAQNGQQGSTEDDTTNTEKKKQEEEEEKLKKIEEAKKPDYRNTKYNFNLQIESVSMKITNDLNPNEPVDIIGMKVGKIAMHFRQREYDMEASLSVKSIAVEDCLQSHGETFRYMVSTNADSLAIREHVTRIQRVGSRMEIKKMGGNSGDDSDNFISIRVNMVSPEAVDVYNNVNSTMKLKVGTLVFSTNHETIPKMAYFFQYQLMPPSPSDIDAEDDDDIEELMPAAGTVQGEQQQIPEGDKTDYLNQALSKYQDEHKKTTKSQLKEEIFLTKVETSFESLQVILCTRGKVLGRALIDGFSASFSDSVEHKRAHLSLDGIWMRDLTGVAPMYPYMIECTKGKKLIDLNVHMRNKTLYKSWEQTDLHSTYLSIDQTPKVTLQGAISGIKLTFLNRFVQEMMGYPNAILAEMAKMKPPEPEEEEDIFLHRSSSQHVQSRSRARSKAKRFAATGSSTVSRRVTDDVKNDDMVAATVVGIDRKRSTYPPGTIDRQKLTATDRKVVHRIKEWKKEKGVEQKAPTINSEAESVFDFYKVDLQLHKIEMVVPQGSKSSNMMVMTLEHIGICNSLVEESGIPQPETATTGNNQAAATHEGKNIPIPDISHQEGGGGGVNLDKPPTFHNMLSVESGGFSATSASQGGSDEFFDCKDLKPIVYTKWDIVLNKLQAVSVFDNMTEGITRDKPLPLFQIQEPEIKGGTTPIAARIIAIQNIPQNKLDPVLHPDLFVLMQVATISVIASRIQLKFLMQLSSKNLAEEPVVMTTGDPERQSEYSRTSSADDYSDSASDGDGIKDDNNNKNGGTTDSQNNDDAGKQEQASSTMKVTVMFNDLIVKLVEDPLADISRTLGLAWNIHLGLDKNVDGKMNVRGMLKDVTMFNTVLNKNQSISDQLKSLQTGHYIMDPFNMSLNVSQGKSFFLKNDALMTAKLYGGLVNLRLTYQDYKLVMKSLEVLSSSESDDDDGKDSKSGEDDAKATITDTTGIADQIKLTKVKGKGLEFMQKVWRRQGGYLVDPRKLNAKTFVGSIESMDEAQSYGEQEIMAIFEGIRITFVNNVTGIDMQFACFDLSHFKTVVSGFAHQQRISTSLGFRANYYNQEIEAWEPMIEPWSLQTDVWMVAGHGMSAQVRADKPLYVNLTRAMVDALRSTRALINKVEKDQKVKTTEGKMQKYSPFMLENLTEMKLRYSLPEGEAKSGDLASSNEAPLLFGEETKNHHVIVTFDGFQPLPPYDMNTVGKVEYKLQPTGRSKERMDDDDDIKLKQQQQQQEEEEKKQKRKQKKSVVFDLGHTIVFENRVVGGIKILATHSTVSISNDTVVELQCGSICIDPGKKRWVPVSVATRGLQFKPISIPQQQKRCDVVVDESKERREDDQYSFSEALTVQSLVDKMEPSKNPDEAAEGLLYSPHITVRCTSTSGRAFYLCVFASKYKSSSVVNLTIRPPFVLENVLTCSATVMVSGSRTIGGGGGGGGGATRSIPEIENDIMSTPLLPKTAAVSSALHGGRMGNNIVTVRIARAGSFEMFSFPATRRCYMQLKVDGYAQSWSEKLEISSKPDNQNGEETKSIPIMPSRSETQMYIHCDMVSAWALGLSHSRRVAIYVPYWIFDATGLSLQLSLDKYTLGAKRIEAPSSQNEDDDQNDQMFAQWSSSSSHAAAADGKSVIDAKTTRNSKKSSIRKVRSIDAKACRRAEMLSVSSTKGSTRVSMKTQRPIRSHWSDYMSLDSAETQVVSCYASATDGKNPDLYWANARFDIGLVSAAGTGKFVRTRMITLCSRHVIVNNLNLRLELRQHRYPGSLIVPAGGRAPFHLIHGTQKELITFRVLAEDREDDDTPYSSSSSTGKKQEQPSAWEWSGSFKISEPGDFGLIVRGKDSSQAFLVRVEVRASEEASDGTLFVVIDREHPDCPPFRIVNRTAFDRLRYCQKSVNKWTVVDPYTLSTYSWDQPLGIKNELALALEVRGDYKGERVYDLNESGHLDRIVLTNPNRILYVYLVAEGPTKVLVLSDLPNPDVVHDPRSSPEEQRKQEKQLRLLQKINSSEVLSRREGLVNQERKRLKRKIGALRTSLKEENADADRDSKSASRSSEWLRITIIEASSVEGVKWHGKSDVYAQVKFNGETRKTKVLRHNLNPWFDQTFDFDVTPSERKMRLDEEGPLHSPMKIALFNKNMVAPADFLGGVILDLKRLRKKISEQKDHSSPVEIQKWLRLDSMRHINRWMARVHIKITWYPSTRVVIQRDKAEFTLQLKMRERCKKVLRKHISQLRQERRQQGLEDVSRHQRSQAQAPVKQVQFTLKIGDAKLNMFEGQLPTGTVVRFADDEPPAKEDEFRVILVVTHGTHKRMCVLHDPDPSVPSVRGVDYDEPFEFYVDEDEVNGSYIRLDCYAHNINHGKGGGGTYRVATAAQKLKSWVHIGYSRLDLAQAPIAEPKAFEDRAAELRDQGAGEFGSTIAMEEDEKQLHEEKRGRDEQHMMYWEKMVVPDENANVLVHSLSGGQLWLSLTSRPAPPPEERAQTVATVSLPEFGVSMIDSTPEEIFFFQIRGMVLAYEDTPVQTTMEASIFHTQLDNCLSNAQFPIVLAPEPMPPSEKKPFLQLSMHQSKTITGVPVSIYQYASFLMQKLKLSIEERIMLRMLSYADEFCAEEADLLGLQNDDDDGSDFVTQMVDKLYPLPASSASKMFFSFLQLHPIAVDISLELSSEVRNQYMSEGGAVFNPLKWLKNAAGTAIDIDEAPIRLKSLTIEDAYGNTSTLLVPIKKHYLSQVLREAYKVLGSLEILGNPVQLVNNLGSGVFDFFYEPAKGLVSSPQDFGRGLARGTTSLLKHTVTGVFGAASKVTGKLAEGIAVLGMDEEFQRQSRMNARRPPRHIGEGVIEGGKSVAMGVFRGVTGIVLDPYHGYRLQGWKGLLRGIGTGVVGVGLKPAAGSIQAASKLLQGIGNTATCCDTTFENDRARYPRYIGQDRVLRPYNPLDAMMAAQLRLHEIQDLSLSKEEKKGETYLRMFCSLNGNLIISNLRILMLSSKHHPTSFSRYRKPPPAVFKLLWEDVKGFEHIANTIVIQSKEQKPKQFKLPNEHEAIECKRQLDKMHPILSQRRRGKIGAAVSGVVKKLNINIFESD